MDILLQFLIESVVIATLGGMVGLGIGASIALVVHRYVPAMPAQVSPWIAMVAFGASFVVGIVSGVVPARRAARFDPVEALRYE
jgi:putative ABC transport system permease protein